MEPGELIYLAREAPGQLGNQELEDMADALEAALLRISEQQLALTKCRDKFLHYEQLHRLKCTADGDEKADRNREMADMCSAVLSPLGG